MVKGAIILSPTRNDISSREGCHQRLTCIGDSVDSPVWKKRGTDDVSSRALVETELVKIKYMNEAINFSQATLCDEDEKLYCGADTEIKLDCTGNLAYNIVGNQLSHLCLETGVLQRMKKR